MKRLLVTLAYLLVGTRAFAFGPPAYTVDVYQGPRAITNAVLTAQPDTLIRVHAGTYNERVFLWKDNIVLQGVSDDQGRRPTIDGTGVLFDLAYPIRVGYNRDYFNSVVVPVVLIGRASTAKWGTMPNGISVNNFEITGGLNLVYCWNSSNFLLGGSLLRDGGQGLFINGGDKNDDATITDTDFRGNGVPGSWKQHQSYTEAKRIRFTRCHYYQPKVGMLGAALKDRSANPDDDRPGTIIEDCTIEEGARSLDLVEPQEGAARLGPCKETIVRRCTFIQTNAGGSKLMHFGDDQSSSGSDPALRPHPERSRIHLTATDNRVQVRRDARIGRYFVLFECTSNDQQATVVNLTLDVGSQTRGLPAPALDWIMDWGRVEYSGLASNVPVGVSVRAAGGVVTRVN